MASSKDRGSYKVGSLQHQAATALAEAKRVAGSVANSARSSVNELFRAYGQNFNVFQRAASTMGAAAERKKPVPNYGKKK